MIKKSKGLRSSKSKLKNKLVQLLQGKKRMDKTRLLSNLYLLSSFFIVFVGLENIYTYFIEISDFVVISHWREIFLLGVLVKASRLSKKSRPTPGWRAPQNGKFSVSGVSGFKFQNGRPFVCIDLHT